MFIALHHLETCAPEERNVYADYMSLLTERAIGYGLGYKHAAPPEQR